MQKFCVWNCAGQPGIWRTWHWWAQRFSKLLCKPGVGSTSHPGHLEWDYGSWAFRLHTLSEAGRSFFGHSPVRKSPETGAGRQHREALDSVNWTLPAEVAKWHSYWTMHLKDRPAEGEPRASQGS